VNSRLISLCVGLLVATVGIDSIYGTERFTFGVRSCATAVQLSPKSWWACYGLGEVLLPGSGRVFTSDKPKDAKVNVATQVSDAARIPGDQDDAAAPAPSWPRLLGIVPGAGATITSFHCLRH